MLFCPRCSNLLLLGNDGNQQQFVCQTCPYIHTIDRTMEKKLHLTRKAAAEVESEKNWTNSDSKIQCPKCRNNGAYFYEQQTRSADEPATLFFKCQNKDCNHQWKEG